MACWLKRLSIVFIIISIILPLQVENKLEAASDLTIPIRVAVLYDGTNSNDNLT